MDPNSAKAGGLVEARIAHLESDVSHLRADVADIKLDLRAMRDQMYDRADRQDAKIDGLKDETSSVRMEIASAKYWGLALAMTITGVMLTVMARGFGWL